MSVVVLDNTEEVAIEAVPVKAPTNVVAVTVLPRAETPDKTYVGVEPIEELLLEPVKKIWLVVSSVISVFKALVAVVAVPVKAPTNVVAVRVFPRADIPEST